MLGINCLLKNQSILPNLKKIVEYTGYTIAANDRRPTIEAVYNNLRRSGLEVDVQTVSHVYEDVFDLSDDTFSSKQEVEDARGLTFNMIKNKRAQILKKNEIGKDSPSVAVSAQIANMISQDMKDKPTMQKLMQDRLLKVARRKLELKGIKPKSQSFTDIISEVLQLENKNPYSVLGNLENAETLFSDFKREFESLAQIAGTPYQQAQIQMYAKELANAAYSFMMSTPEANKVVIDTLKSAGYTREINAASGVKQVVDWRKVISDNVDFRKTVSDVFSKAGFSANEIKRISDEMENDFNRLQRNKAESALNLANKIAAKDKPNNFKPAMDKAVWLYQLGVFNNANKDALLKVLGVSNADASQISSLQSLMKQYNDSLRQPMAAWSATYVKTLQREIENTIERIEEKDIRLKAVRVWGFINQMNSAAILNNLQNLYENTASGFVETFITAMRNPKQAAETAKIFGNVFVDYFKGGVREGHELSNAFNTSGNLEDRFNYETAKTTKGKVAAFFGLAPRILLGTFDNSFKAAITHSLTLNTLNKLLKKQGLTNNEASLVINEMYYGNRAEVERVAKELQNRLIAAGVKNVSGKWRRIAAEISIANIMSGGKFFSDTMERLKSDGVIDKSKDVSLSKELLKSIRNAAESTAGKGLGHEADSMAMKLMDNISAGLQKNITEARKNKDKDALIRAELGRNAYGMVNRFRSGALRWTWLSFQKASGYALIQTLITDVVANKGKYLNIDNLNLSIDDEQSMTQDLSRYMALRQRLVRETFVPLVSYTVGYMVILPMMLKAFGGDSDDPEKRKQAMGKLAVWIQNDPARKRWFQKGLPVGVYSYLARQTKTIKGEVSEVKNIRLPSFADVIDPQIATEAIVSNFNESSLYKLANDLKSEMNKNEPNIGKVFGQFGGNFLNLGAVLKSYQINKDAVNGLRGVPTKISSMEYNSLKPGDFWDGFLYNTLNRGLYKSATGKGE